MHNNWEIPTFYYKFAGSHPGKIEHHKTCVQTKLFTRKKLLCLIDPVIESTPKLLK